MYTTVSTVLCTILKRVALERHSRFCRQFRPRTAEIARRHRWDGRTHRPTEESGFLEAAADFADTVKATECASSTPHTQRSFLARRAAAAVHVERRCISSFLRFPLWKQEIYYAHGFFLVCETREFFVFIHMLIIAYVESIILYSLFCFLLVFFYFI